MVKNQLEIYVGMQWLKNFADIDNFIPDSLNSGFLTTTVGSKCTCTGRKYLKLLSGIGQRVYYNIL